MRAAGRYGGQRGGATPIAVACLALTLLLCLCLADVGLLLSARYGAQNAADSCALAAAQESFPLFATGVGSARAARTMARLNSVSLTRISESPGGGRVEVEVRVEPPSLLLGRLGVSPGAVTARAAAEVDVEALLDCGSVWCTPGAAAVAPGHLRAGARAGDSGSAASLAALLALAHLGKPYRWGANGPAAFDCSGLVCYVYAQLGVHLPRTTFSQAGCGRSVSADRLTPGDLVFFRGNAHVGIYIGSGCYVHAPRTGDVVKVSSLDARRDLSGCRRVL